jgi:molybdopterin-guanine dinucleotide biosynthesis protein
VRARALVHVTGSSGAGKTALVEALLSRDDHMIAAVRCVRDDSSAEPSETPANDDHELGRYVTAGASATARYTFPGGRDAHDAFFLADVMQDYSHAVVMEGDRPTEFADLTAFVAPATAGRVLVRRKSDEPSTEKAALDALTAALSQPSGLEEFLTRLVGPAVGQAAREMPELLEQQRLAALADLTEVRSRPTPKHRMRWTLADPYRGIEHAQLVVVNVRTDAERELAKAVLAAVDRLRKDDAVHADVMGPRGSRVPITAVIANLADPNDPGTKKAIARIRRALRRDD